VVKVNDHTVENLLCGDFSDRISYLTQEPYIFNASIQDNITLGKNVLGGEKQRIVLSRGLVRKNNVLILD